MSVEKNSPPDYSHIPEELKSLPRWVNWRREIRGDKPTKVPIDPRTGRNASCADPRTWGTYEEAVTRYKQGDADGIGFQLGFPHAGVDLDNCRDPITGRVEPWAEEIIRLLNSYTESSPSGCGVHVLAKGTFPDGARRRGGVEMYSSGRFFTMTGNHLPDTPSTIENREVELKRLHAKVFEKKCANTNNERRHQENYSAPSLTDPELIEKAQSAENGDKFSRLWEGDSTGYDSPSEADLALCAILAFWTRRDVERIDRLFRQSGLCRPKWGERHGGDGRTYGQITIDKAIEDTSEAWSSSHRSNTAGLKTEEANHPLPVIVVNNRQLRDLTKVALGALEAANEPPVLFVRGGALARVRKDENGRPIIDNVGEYELRHRLSCVADYVRESRRQRAADRPPPMELVRDVLALGEWNFPPLEGIVEVPVLRPDGTVLNEPGYDSSTHLVYVPAVCLNLPQIPPNPSRDDVADAKALVEEAIGEFPYEDEASKANAMGLLLSPVMRPAINGQIPLACVNAPQPGTGKSLLASVISIIATGRDAPVMSPRRDEEEWRKGITATLFEGSTFITIDNIENPLESAALAAVLTAAIWRDRILGRTATLTVPQRATWVANGNNLRLGGDLPRRSYWIRLDAKTSRPWQRAGFKHRELIEWALENRGKVLAAVLTIARAWYAAGKPAGQVPVLGGFQSWATTIGGTLVHAGFIDPGTGKLAFLGNLNEMYELADESTAQWEDFIQALSEAYPDESFTAKDLAEQLGVDPALGDALPDELEDGPKNGSLSRRLGNAFSKRVGRRYGDLNLHMERDGQEKRAIKWRVVTG